VKLVNDRSLEPNWIGTGCIHGWNSQRSHRLRWLVSIGYSMQCISVIGSNRIRSLCVSARVIWIDACAGAFRTGCGPYIHRASWQKCEPGVMMYRNIS
jgi:hypothetical protein